MSLTELWSWLENTSLAMRIGESWWFPLLESIHVVAITFVIGSLLMVDLRLIGIAARDYGVSRMSASGSLSLERITIWETRPFKSSCCSLRSPASI
jgi:hypothetical protein